MTGRFIASCVLLLLCWHPAAAQQPSEPQPEGIATLLSRLEAQITAGDRSGFPSLLGPNFTTDEARRLADDLFVPDIDRAFVREVDRVAEGDGYRLVIEVFTEVGGRARIVTGLVDVHPQPDEPGAWRFTSTQGLTAVEGLYRLHLDTAQQFSARNLTVRAEDLQLTLAEGAVFLVRSDDGIAGLVLSGRGTMQFSPAPQTERGQLRIFAGAETLTAEFEDAFVRLNPAEYEERIAIAALTPVTPNPRDVRRAEDVFAREAPKSYTFQFELPDASLGPWYMLPQRGDFLTEVQTRRHGTLTYSRTAVQLEDITLFNRETRRTISLYPSAARAGLGRAFADDDLREYDVLEYDIETRVYPERGWLEGRARMRVRVLADVLSTFMLRLSDTLQVTNVSTVEHGRLLPLRISNQNNVIVNMPFGLLRDEEVTLVISYAGDLVTQSVDSEGVAVAAQDFFDLQTMLQPSYLLSNRALWYPQNPISDYATARLRISVPQGYGAVASGIREDGVDVTLTDLMAMPNGQSFVFNAEDPLRYFAIVISRFERVAESTVFLDTMRPRVSVTIETNPRQQRLGRDMMETVEDMLQFYSGLVGDTPYGAATVALVEGALPGGHSPGYFAVLNTPVPTLSNQTWRNDPAAFDGYPEFFLAHELAHQWWGQAVGWRNYHEQWISEAFAQYFAALYARSLHGEALFNDMLRQFRRWALAESDQGPIHLGTRVGHIQNDPRIFRAVIYNKGAGVLHMLHRLVGDDAFLNGIRRLYTEQKFRKAGTEDVRRAFEAESGRSLERFFERWIYEDGIPQVRWSRSIEPGVVTVRFEQRGEAVFDLPVTVTVSYRDGRTQDIVVPVTDRIVEERILTDGQVRQVEVNRDNAALAEFSN